MVKSVPTNLSSQRIHYYNLRLDDVYVRGRLHLPVVASGAGQHLVHGQTSTGPLVRSSRRHPQPRRSLHLPRLHRHETSIQTDVKRGQSSVTET